MPKKSIFGKKIEETINSDDILGKDVIDAEGKVVGVVEKVLIDPIKLDFVGIEVDKGFLKKGVIIGKSYISKLGKHALFLNIKIVYEIKGMEVLDKIGKEIGKVSDLELWGGKNKIKTVSINGSSGKFIVPGNLIDAIGENVVLTIEEAQLSKFQKKL